MNQTEVQRYYDDFLQSRMLNYRLYGNLRLEKAIARILPELGRGAKILDIGCGIGMVTERMAKVARNGQVWGVDISEKNIWYARQTVSVDNLTFFASDVVNDFEAVKDAIEPPIDVITMIDVIEHIPAEVRPTLFSRLREISADNALLILTLPSPQYQRYLRDHKPEALQIIDNVVELDELIREAGLARYSLKHYSLETVWKRNQYVHCILQTNDELADLPEVVGWKAFKEVVSKIKRTVSGRLLLPLKKRKYIDRVFKGRVPW